MLLMEVSKLFRKQPVSPITLHISQFMCAIPICTNPTVKFSNYLCISNIPRYTYIFECKELLLLC